MERTRDHTLDAMKGILIIMVVVGHVIVSIYAPDNYTGNILFKICYSFHMPAFIMISGYFTGKRGLSDINAAWAGKRIAGIGIPYLIWLCISLVVSNHYLSPRLIWNNLLGGTVWFLRFLLIADFSMFLIALTYRKIARRRQKTPEAENELAFVIGGGITYVIIIMIFIADRNALVNEAVFYPFYIAGVLLANKGKIMECIKKNRRWILNSCIVLYPLAMCFYCYDADTRAGFVSNLLGGQTTGMAYFMAYAGYTFFCKYIVGLLGTGFLYRILQFRTINGSLIVKSLAIVGQCTLQIYVLGGFLYVRCFSSQMLNSVLSVITAVGGALLIVYFVRKIPHLHRVLFGRE